MLKDFLAYLGALLILGIAVLIVWRLVLTILGG